MSLVSLINLFYRIDSFPAEVSLRIECAKLITQGKIPYVDFFVLDSPLSLFLACIPVKVASILGLKSGYGIASCAIVFAWILSLVSLILTVRILFRKDCLEDALWCKTVLFTIVFLNLACVYQFGQIEHLLMLSMVPYIFARRLEYLGKKLQALDLFSTGILSGIAIMLDPCFWVAPVVIELAFIASFKRASCQFVSTTTVLAATAIAINSAIYGLGSEMMRGYRLYIWPFIAVDRQNFDIYLYGNQSCPDSRIFIYILIVGSLLSFSNKKHSSIITPFIASGWLAFVYLVMTCKGFYFQALPMFFCGTLLLAVHGSSLISKFSRPLVLVTVFLTATTCGSLLIQQYEQELARTAAVRLKYEESHVVPDFITTITDRTKEFDKLIVLSNNVSPLYPIATLKERIPASRIMWSFHFPLLELMKKPLTQTPPEERERLRKFYEKILLEDIENNRPKLIISDQSDAAMAIEGSDLEKLIKKYYRRRGETQFFSDNLPPRERTAPDFPLWVDCLEPTGNK